jgi:serine/threonine protein kinase
MIQHMLTRLIRKWSKPKAPAAHGKKRASADSTPGSGCSSPSEWKPGDLILDRYRVVQTMSGSMGNVYISEHLGWATKMAIKSPRPEVLTDREGVKRILKEANGWIRMGMHPNIATCYYVLAIKKIPHLFIEYVDGGSLADWLKTGKCRDLRTALSLAVQFCHGMEYTHAHGIIHRDIKPANILITKNSLLKITDFGILLTISDQDTALAEGTEEEATVGFRGTPGFASPEQFNDAHAVDQRTDIFSFGICLWLMLCGTKPFEKNNIKSPVPEPIPLDLRYSFPPNLTETLKKCVAYEQSDRFQDFVAVRQALNEAYTAIFKVPCPYATLPQTDLRADSLNNRAVSLFELNKASQAEKFLKQALEINDVLPEAIHNLILLNWWNGQLSAPRAVRKLEAALQRLGKVEILLKLRDLLTGLPPGDSGEASPRSSPDLRLCQPQSSLAVFRQGQLYRSIGRSMLDHLENGRYDACQEVLLTAWRNSNFKKDKAFTTVYERLLHEGRKQKVESAQRLAVLPGNEQPIVCLAYVPFSRTIVTSSRQGQIFLWDFVQKKIICTLGKEGLPVYCLAANPKGKEVAVGSGDGTVGVWSVGSFRQIGSRSAHSAAVTALAYGLDGRWLVSGGEDGSLTAVQMATGREIRYSAGGGPVRALLVEKKGKTFITGSEDGNIRFWNTDSRNHVRIVEAHDLPVQAFSGSPDGNRFVSGSGDGLLKLWDIHSGRCLRTIQAHEEPITSVLILADGSHLVSGCADDIIKIWNLENGECRMVLDGRGDGILSLAAGPKPHMFLAGRRDGAVMLLTTIYSLGFER